MKNVIFFILNSGIWRQRWFDVRNGTIKNVRTSALFYTLHLIFAYNIPSSCLRSAFSCFCMSGVSKMSNVPTKFLFQVFCWIRASNWNPLAKYFLLIRIITSITKREIGNNRVNAFAYLFILGIGLAYLPSLMDAISSCPLSTIFAISSPMYLNVSTAAISPERIQNNTIQLCPYENDN